MKSKRVLEIPMTTVGGSSPPLSAQTGEDYT
jgi:hypothetical protein